MKKIVPTFLQYVKENMEINENSDKIGIDWDVDFNLDKKEQIEENVRNNISELIIEGYTSGILSGEDPSYNGTWDVEITYDDDHSDDITNEEVARLIKEGYNQSYEPNFIFSAYIYE